MLRVTLFHGRQPVFEGTAAHVVLPAADGELSILEDHGPMLCVLGQGVASIDDARFPVRGGIARVARNTVTILTGAGR